MSKTTEPACLENVIHPQAVQEARRGLVDGSTAARLAQLFAALSDPTRVRLISALNGHELCVCDLAAVLGMTQSAVSHQLRLLRSLNLVRYRKAGRIVFYALDDQHIHDLFVRGLEHVAHQVQPASIAV